MDSNCQSMILDGRTVAKAIEHYLKERVFRPGTVVKVITTTNGICDGPFTAMNVSMVIETPIPPTQS